MILVVLASSKYDGHNHSTLKPPTTCGSVQYRRNIMTHAVVQNQRMWCLVFLVLGTIVAVRPETDSFSHGITTERVIPLSPPQTTTRRTSQRTVLSWTKEQYPNPMIHPVTCRNRWGHRHCDPDGLLLRPPPPFNDDDDDEHQSLETTLQSFSHHSYAISTPATTTTTTTTNHPAPSPPVQIHVYVALVRQVRLFCLGSFLCFQRRHVPKLTLSCSVFNTLIYIDEMEFDETGRRYSEFHHVFLSRGRRICKIYLSPMDHNNNNNNETETQSQQYRQQQYHDGRSSRQNGPDVHNQSATSCL